MIVDGVKVSFVGLDDAENGRKRAGEDVLSEMKAKYGG